MQKDIAPSKKRSPTREERIAMIETSLREIELLTTRSEPELFKHEHASLQLKRLKKYARDGYYGMRAVCNAERIYAAEWKRFNKSRDNVLAHILCPDASRPNTPPWFWTPPPYSRRDAAVAATVIQWLATAVGNSFLMEAERKVGREDLRAARRAEADWAAHQIQVEAFAKRARDRRAFVNRASTRQHQREAVRKQYLNEIARREREREERRRTERRAIRVRER